MDSQLRELIDDGFGAMAEPPHPPVAAHLHAGQRAVRRRRTVTGVVAGLAAAACVATLAASGVLVPGTGDQADPDVAGDRRTGQSIDTSAPWGADEMVRYEDGEPMIRPGARVVDRVDDWMPSDRAADSVAVEVEFQGAAYWADAILGKDGTSSSGVTQPGAGWANFRDWVADQAEANGGDPDAITGGDPASSLWNDMVRWDGDGTRLAAKHGLSIVAQRGDIDLGESFAPPGARTAVARVRGSGIDVFVLVRELDGMTDQITSRARSGDTLDLFLERAEAQYAGGEGLR